MQRFTRLESVALLIGRRLPGLVLPLLAACVLAGCVSKSTAEARARTAFLQGQQQQAAMTARQIQSQGPSVTVVGEVRNAVVRWTPDLTLAKAVIAADYYGTTDPKGIVIRRAGNQIPYDTRVLLNGQDVPLEPNDVIELVH